MALVFDKLGLTAPQKAVLLALADHANEYGESIYPSVETLGRKTALGERTIRRSLGELRGFGIIREVRPASQHRPTEYAIDLPRLQAWVPEVPVRHPTPATPAPLEAPRPAAVAPEPSVSLTTIEPPPPAVKPPGEKPSRKGHKPWTESIDALMTAFSEKACILRPEPKSKSDFAAMQTFWAKPLKELELNCNGNSRAVIAQAIDHMRANHLNVSSPKSILSVALSLNGEARSRSEAAPAPRLQWTPEEAAEQKRQLREIAARKAANHAH
jgi:hypothetical protein